jgi:hypothetical protein
LPVSQPRFETDISKTRSTRAVCSTATFSLKLSLDYLNFSALR